MEYKRIIVVLCTCLTLYQQIKFAGCVTNHPNDLANLNKNNINYGDWRGAESGPERIRDQEVHPSSSQAKGRFFLSPSYEGNSLESSGFGSYTQSNAYLPPYYNPSPTGSHNGDYGSSHGYGFYPDTGFSTVRGPGASTPSKTGYGSLALKGLLIPLAGIALLGAAAALSTNPVLLQLGVLNGRRKRSLELAHIDVYPANPNAKPDEWRGLRRHPSLV